MITHRPSRWARSAFRAREPTPLTRRQLTMVSAEEATLELMRTHLICSLLNLKQRGIVWRLAEGLVDGAAAGVVVDGVAVGDAVVAAEDKSLTVAIAADHREKGLGTLVANKAIVLAASKGIKELTARVQPGSGGARLAARLRFVEVRADARELHLRLELVDVQP